MRLLASLLVLFIVLVAATPGAASPEGQMTWGVHISLAPTWFDPAETPGIATPFMVLYALHDALVKPMPGNAMELKNLIYSISGAFGNVATRIETFVASGSPYAYGSYPDIDGLFREQAGELDRKRREAILHRIQQLMHERTLYAPIWELGFIHAQGPRVAESGLGLITGWAFSAPYEDVRLKGK